MNAIDTFPAADMPLRARLPNLSEGTRDALIAWGMMQPGSLPWLVKRSALYWDRMPPPPGQMWTPHSMALDATAALDLLRHRSKSVTDREAVEHLNDSSSSDGDMPPPSFGKQNNVNGMSPFTAERCYAAEKATVQNEPKREGHEQGQPGKQGGHEQGQPGKQGGHEQGQPGKQSEPGKQADPGKQGAHEPQNPTRH